MPLDNPVLLVIDVQNGFINENSRSVIENIKKLISSFQKHELPVVFTRFINLPGSPFDSLIDWPHVATPPDTDIVGDLQLAAKKIFEKHFYTALTDELETQAIIQKWNTLVICGIATESCVLKTAADAFEHGFRPIVISDACVSDAGPEAHAAGLLVLKYLIGEKQIVSVNELRAALDA